VLPRRRKCHAEVRDRTRNRRSRETARHELQAISQKSCSVLNSMGPQSQWVQSYVTDDKIYCVYVAPDEGTVRAHAVKGGFPADAVARVGSVIDPTTAE
jgi:hypothetical protein